MKALEVVLGHEALAYLLAVDLVRGLVEYIKNVPKHTSGHGGSKLGESWF
jgi:hypothetical protein